MPGKRERHTVGDPRKDVGLVREENDGRVVRDLGQSAGQVVYTFEPAPRPLPTASNMRHLVAEAGEPERLAVLGKPNGIILVDRNANALQHAPPDDGTLAGAL